MSDASEQDPCFGMFPEAEMPETDLEVDAHLIRSMDLSQAARKMLRDPVWKETFQNLWNRTAFELLLGQSEDGHAPSPELLTNRRQKLDLLQEISNEIAGMIEEGPRAERELQGRHPQAH